MITFRQLARFGDTAKQAVIHEIAHEHGHRNVFNPSFGVLGEQLVIAYRAIAEGERHLRSYVVTRCGARGRFAVTDLTEIAEERGVTRVADPKVIESMDALYVTFNTGFSADAENDIFLVRVAPEIGEFQRVVADFDRQRVEKNWAFQLSDDEGPKAIYQLHPYREVHLTAGDVGSADDLRFALRAPSRASSGQAAGLSIGTQLLRSSEGHHQLIAHEKWTIRRKRSYFGRAVRIEGLGTDEVSVRVGSTRLIHRWQDALPHRPIHNRNLMSATYFSGARYDGDDVILGYGINDVDCSLVRVPSRMLWP